MKPHVAALVGAQYGSEGKGTIAYEIAGDYDIHVRTGAPNAGHTIRHEGRTWKMRSVPCGWINPDARLVIGAGALLDAKLLVSEVEEIEAAGYEVESRLFIDWKAQILLPEFHAWEGGVDGTAHDRIGSTGEGVGLARMAKIARGTVDVPPFDMFAAVGDSDTLRGFQTTDTARLLHGWIGRDKSVLLEGTQGQGLSLTHGQWPYCTSNDCGAAQLCADAGVPPMALQRVILVARTYPIRVAGNSGPLAGETTWEELGQQPEQTTVTLKTRRVGGWDENLFVRSVALNGATEIALTFADYLDGEATGWDHFDEFSPLVRGFIRSVEHQADGVPVSMVGVGGPDFKVIRRAPQRSVA